jgi:hypothetical protein
LLTFPVIVAGVAVLVAVVALFRARRSSARAERLSESYWELRYEVGQLKVRLDRVETASGLREPEPDVEADASSSPPKTTFVPLSSLRK